MVAAALPSYVRGEVASALCALHPDVREMFNRERVEWTGAEFEELLVGVWLAGYGQGVGDCLAVEAGEPVPLLDWMMERAAS